MKKSLHLLVWFILCVYCPANVIGQADCSTNGLLVDAKTSSTAQYKPYDTRTLCQLPEFYENAPVIATNIYGSRLDKQTTATGFYYAKQIDGRWWVVDPLGYLSICRGVNAISKGTGNTSVNSFNSKFGNSTTTWMNKTKELLANNGFFCAGAWSATTDIKTNQNQDSKPLAYTLILNWMSGYGAGRTSIQPGHAGYPFDAIFVFEKGFADYCETKAQALAVNKNDTNIFGYFTDNELPFYNVSLTNFLEIGTVAPNDENYLATLKWLSDNGYTLTDASNADVKARFLGYVAKTYFSIVYNAIKKYDPNHMVLGPRINVKEARENPYFMQAAGPYVDILAVNYYNVWTPDIAGNINWSNNLGKPFIVTEFYTKGDDVGLANTSGAGWIVKTQTDRGYFYQNYTLGLLESKCCVGWHWFKYMDNDPSIVGAEPSNIDANKGIVSVAYEPYTNMLDKMRDLNLRVFNVIDYFDKPYATTKVYPEADAYFKGAENHGFDDRLGIKLTTDPSTFRESFLRFDLSGQNANVKNVDLKLWVLRAGDPNITYRADFVADDNWAESSITLAQHPAAAYEIGRWSHSTNVTQDVTDAFIETINTDKKLSIKLLALNNVVSQLEYASRENSDANIRPCLVVWPAGPTNDAHLSDLFVQGNRVTAFQPSVFTYQIVLPAVTLSHPEIGYVRPNRLMNVTLANPANVISANAADRTAVIEVTSADGQQHNTYKIEFIVEGQLSSARSTSFRPDFYIIPNPMRAGSTFTLSLANRGQHTILVTDLSGKQFYKSTLENSSSVIGLENLCRGMYLVTLSNHQGVVTKKIIVN